MTSLPPAPSNTMTVVTGESEPPNAKVSSPSPPVIARPRTLPIARVSVVPSIVTPMPPAPNQIETTWSAPFASAIVHCVGVSDDVVVAGDAVAVLIDPAVVFAP